MSLLQFASTRSVQLAQFNLQEFSADSLRLCVAATEQINSQQVRSACSSLYCRNEPHRSCQSVRQETQFQGTLCSNGEPTWRSEKVIVWFEHWALPRAWQESVWRPEGQNEAALENRKYFPTLRLLQEKTWSLQSNRWVWNMYRGKTVFWAKPQQTQFNLCCKWPTFTWQTCWCVTAGKSQVWLITVTMAC